jgi:Tfp pilus assembly protein PilO
MTRIIFPLILVIAAIGLFVVYTNPNYQDIGTLRTQQSAYNQALNNSQELLKVRNTLTDKYNNLPSSDRDRLQKLMPDTVDNIRLIIDIQNIALGHGMNPKDIKYDARTGTAVGVASQQAANSQQLANTQKDYGTFELEFSVTGPYQNFLSFIQDLEQSLRLVDIESVTFQSADLGGSTMKYLVRVRTYWLKN